MRPQTSLRAALADPNLLGTALGGDTWIAWRSLLLAAMGEELLPGELEHFRKLTGRDEPPHQRVSEFWGIVGRRGGKSTAVAVLAVYLVALCRWPMLSPGEAGHVLIVAPDRSQGGVILDYARATLNGSPILRQLVQRDIRKEGTESVDLTTGVTITLCAASLRSLRGFTSIAVIADEVAYWDSNDTEILAAARSTLLTTRGPLIAVSAPRGKRGVLWETYRRHYGPDGAADVLVAQGDLNPTLELAPGAQFRADPLSPAPELPVVVRVAVPDLDTSKFATSPPTPEPQPRSRPRKSREAPPTPPTYFTTQTSKPSGDNCGSIAEGWYSVRRGLVFVTDASGVELGEGRKIDKSGVLWTARQILRAHLPAKRGPGPDHSPIVYPRVGWR